MLFSMNEKGNKMKISKDECDKDFANKSLTLSDEKCDKCEYYSWCPYIARALNEVTDGDD